MIMVDNDIDDDVETIGDAARECIGTQPSTSLESDDDVIREKSDDASAWDDDDGRRAMVVCVICPSLCVSGRNRSGGHWRSRL
jgi:hypothetical protein